MTNMNSMGSTMEGTAFFSLGSNCGDRRENILKALALLRERLVNNPEVKDYVSDIYETPDAHGGPRPYMNAVMAIQTALEATVLERTAKEIELKLGRTPEARLRGEVPIDIDLVEYNREILRPRDFKATFFSIGYQNVLSRL